MRRDFFSQIFVFLFHVITSQSQLRPSSELVSNCYNFPDENYSRTSCIQCKYGYSPKVLHTYEMHCYLNDTTVFGDIYYIFMEHNDLILSF